VRVGNDLPRDYTEEELKAKFKEFGEIGDVYLPRDRGSRDTRGFGFIRFFERKDQEYCVDECKKDPLMIDGMECKVEIASRRPPKAEDSYRGGGRDSYRGGRDRSRERYRSRSRSRDRGYSRRDRSRSRSRGRRY
jgi:RNA recognition motif-containing protein